MDCKELGFTPEELQQRVVDQCCERLLKSMGISEYGGECERDSTVTIQMKKEIQNRLDEQVERVGEEHILPLVSEHIEGLIIKETNQYGEKKGDSKTFIEYLVERAEHYLLEQVDYMGKTKKQSRDSYSYREKGSRVSHLVHEHLNFHIEKAMKEAVGNANKTIAEGLAETCKIKLGEIADKLKVEVKTG